MQEKYSAKNDLFLGPFYRYATQGVASEARRGPLIAPQMVLDSEYADSPGCTCSVIAGFGGMNSELTFMSVPATEAHRVVNIRGVEYRPSSH
jgi:hypothetical protein